MNRAAAVAAPVLHDLARRVQPVTLARDRRIAVGSPLDTVLPEGLARGTTVAVGARPGVAGATSLTLALVAHASQDGAWVAVVGAPWLGLVAVAEAGVVLERLVVVDVDGTHAVRGVGGGAYARVAAAASKAGSWLGSRADAVGGRSGGGGPSGSGGGGRAHLASVVAALVDGFDVVLVGPAVGRRLRPVDTRRLAARVRERTGVMVALGHDLPGGVAQVRLEVTASTWEGLAEGGGGHLQRCRATVEATGRGAASRLRRAEVLLRGTSARGDGSRLFETGGWSWGLQPGLGRAPLLRDELCGQVVGPASRSSSSRDLTGPDPLPPMGA